MTANPLTDQILANRPEVRSLAAEAIKAPAAAVAEDCALFAKRISAALPDIDPAIVGEVLLHASDLYLTFATTNGHHPAPVPALIAVQLLGEAGELLYGANEPEDGNTNNRQEQS